MRTLLTWPNNIFLGLILFVFLIIVSNFLTPVSSFDLQKQLVIQEPNNPEVHLALGIFFLESNDLPKARVELAAIKKLPLEKQAILQSEIMSFANLTATEETLRGQLFDLAVAQDLYPRYRDLLLKRALLSWRVKDDSQARSLFAEAQYLDPNGSLVQQVAGVIQLSH